jgi:hypothetical protein
MRVTAQQKAYANGYAQCFIEEGLGENYDTDYQFWFSLGDMEFRLHFDNGLVVVDAYKVKEGASETRMFQRVFVEKEA